MLTYVAIISSIWMSGTYAVPDTNKYFDLSCLASTLPRCGKGEISYDIALQDLPKEQKRMLACRIKAAQFCNIEEIKE